jgi:hypothetical protein
MTEKVEIEIVATDEASKAIGDVNSELKSMSDVVKSGALRDLKDASVEVFKAIGAAAGEFVNIAAESEVVSARLDAQLKALGGQTKITAEQINGLADELSKVSGFDDEDLIEAQTALLRFGNLSEKQFDQATRAATDLAAATGMDLESSFRLLGRALEDPQRGLALLERQVGKLSATQREQIKTMTGVSDAEKSLVASAKKRSAAEIERIRHLDLSKEKTGQLIEAEKKRLENELRSINASNAVMNTAGAQAIILDALTGKVNGAAEAIGSTWTGKVKIARVETDNMKQAIGDLMLNGLNLLPQSAITAGTALGDFSTMAGSLIGPMADLAIILKGMPGLLTSIKVATTGLLGPIGLVVAAFGAWVFIMNELSKAAVWVGTEIRKLLGIKLSPELEALAQTLIKHGSFSVEGQKNAWGTGINMITGNTGPTAGVSTGASVAPRVSTTANKASGATVNVNVGTLVGDRQTSVNALIPMIREALRQLGVSTSG